MKKPNTMRGMEAHMDTTNRGPQLYSCPECHPPRVMGLKSVSTVMGLNMSHLVYECFYCGFECTDVFIL